MANKIYIVKSGDTLYKIAQKYNTTISKILADNPDIENPNLIYPGKRIILNNPKNEKCSYKPFPEQNGIDFSSVNYICSEKLRNIRLEKAIIDVFNLDQTVDSVRYYYNNIDLNDDRKEEIFVYLVGSYVCGTGGCSSAIFEKSNRRYVLLSRFSLVNNPVLISNNKTNGYKNIIMYVAGGGIKIFYAILQYNGTTYPSNPSVQSKVKPGAKLSGKGIVADDITMNPGIKL